MEALILVCALTVSTPDCQKDNAIAVFYGPEAHESLSGCLRHGTLYAASSRLVTEGTYSKIVCGRPKIVAKNDTNHS